MIEQVSALQPWLMEKLEGLVRIESPSDDPAAVNAAMAFAEVIAVELAGEAIWHKQKEFGDVLELHFDHMKGRKPVLLLGHLDTVWPLGTLAGMPLVERDGRLFGPGVLDMKAGVMMALTATKLLKEMGLHVPITLLLNSEEEIGSPVSRPITERVALQSEAVFVLEPPQGLAYKTARKGVGNYEVHVTGVASHAGVDFDRGHSAIREMAHLIQVISGFTEPSLRRTVNVGVIRGGTRSNVVAAECCVEVDVRIATADDAERVEALFQGLRTVDPACSVRVTGGMNRPPMERTAGTVALFERARKCAETLGFALGEASTGGGSDGNFTSALGIPTLDGMGAVGDDAHAAHESIVLEHLVPRTALLAMMIAEFVA